MPKFFIPVDLDGGHYQINTPNDAYPVSIRVTLGVLTEAQLPDNAEILDAGVVAEHPVIRLRLKMANGKNYYRYASALASTDLRTLIGREAFGSTIRSVRPARRRVLAA